MSFKDPSNYQEYPAHVLSLGAGVQSSALALMAAKGMIKPMPDVAIFADTQSEPESVYTWLDWLENQLPFPVVRVTNGNLEEACLELVKNKKGQNISKTAIPNFTQDKTNGEQGFMRQRFCTADYKIKPIMAWIKDRYKIKRGEKVARICQWIGISMDEIQRVKESQVKWMKHRWPLVEIGMHRPMILQWFKDQGYPEPPRSACYFCAFHDDNEWRRLRDEEPQSFAKAIEFEKEFQQSRQHIDQLNSVPYLHRSCRPLDQIDLRTDIDKGQSVMGFIQECEGMCGL